MFSKVPSCAFSDFWTLTLKLTQHFDLIYNIGKSDWKILRNIMKTAQDSYTITIKQIVIFRRGCILKNLKLIKFKMAAYQPLFTSTGLILWNIIKNRSRYLHHYYKTNCKASGEDAFCKKFNSSKFKMAANRPLFTFTWPLFGKPC